MTVLCVLLLAILAPFRAVVDQSVDVRLNAASAFDAARLPRFLDYAANGRRDVFKANPDFWAKGIDFSCASPWNSAGGRTRAGTAISRRHIVFAKHFPMGKGTRIVFVGDLGEPTAYYIEKTKAMLRGDIMIGSLNVELTPDIHPAKILPDDYTNYIGHAEGLPVVSLNQHEMAFVSEIMSISTNSIYDLVHCRRSERPNRNPYCDKIRSGDSGSPVFLVVRDEPIFLYFFTTPTGGYPIRRFRREVQQIMDELCPGYKLESYTFR